jgi:hypothetical protein
VRPHRVEGVDGWPPSVDVVRNKLTMNNVFPVADRQVDGAVRCPYPYTYTSAPMHAHTCTRLCMRIHTRGLPFCTAPTPYLVW